MSRYIDADELHNQGWVAARYINWEPTPLNDNFRLEVEVKPFITFHAVDVVEVVRCKDCRYRHTYRDITECDYMGEDCEENGYCSYGERRDE